MSSELIFALLALAVLVAAVARGAPRHGRRLCADTGRHYRRCYSRRGFLKIGGALLAAGLLAHSGADEAVDDAHREGVRGAGSDRLAAPLKALGERWWFLVWGLFAVADAARGSNPLTRWGRRNWEAMLAGLPMLWAMQYGLGASRPTDGDNLRGSRWNRPLRDDNSASGHAFIAAIPWLTAARAARGRLPRAGAYAGSLLTGWSRINDRKHYLSQVWLGWFAAWSAVAAVAAAGAPETAPAPDDSGAGGARSATRAAD